MNFLLSDAVKILTEGTNDNYYKIEAILEDHNSPTTRSYRDKLLNSVIDRSHIDFGDIAKSKGDITRYSGLTAMEDVLSVLLKLAEEENSNDLKEAVNTVKVSIENIKSLKTLYMKGFTKGVDLAMIEYNTFVYNCVESTTSLVFSYVDFLKTPSSPVYELHLKDNKYRADVLYISQLKRFNKICEGKKYQKYLQFLVNEGLDKVLSKPGVAQEAPVLTASLAVGMGFIAAVALAIIPLTREIIYRIKDCKRKLSELFMLQAYLLEINKTSLEYDPTINDKKKEKILAKQEKLRLKFLWLADKLRVRSAQEIAESKKKLSQDNKELSVDDIEDEVNNSDIDIL